MYLFLEHQKKYPLIIKCVCIRRMGYLLTEFTRFASFPMSSSSRVLQDTEQGMNSIVLWWLLKGCRERMGSSSFNITSQKVLLFYPKRGIIPLFQLEHFRYFLLFLFSSRGYASGLAPSFCSFISSTTITFIF